MPPESVKHSRLAARRRLPGQLFDQWHMHFFGRLYDFRPEFIRKIAGGKTDERKAASLQSMGKIGIWIWQISVAYKASGKRARQIRRSDPGLAIIAAINHGISHGIESTGKDIFTLRGIIARIFMQQGSGNKFSSLYRDPARHKIAIVAGKSGNSLAPFSRIGAWRVRHRQPNVKRCNRINPRTKRFYGEVPKLPFYIERSRRSRISNCAAVRNRWALDGSWFCCLRCW